MIGTETLMARALRYVVDKNNLTVDSLTTIPGPLKSQLQDLSIEVAEYLQPIVLVKQLVHAMKQQCILLDYIQIGGKAIALINL